MLSTLGKLVRRIGAATDQATLRVLSDLLIASDAAAKSYCRWNLEAADFTEYHDAGHREIILDQMYVSAVTGTSVDDVDLDYGVWVDSERAWADDTKLVSNTDYRLINKGTSGILRLLSHGYGHCGYGQTETIRMIYRAGFEEDAIPADLSDAVDQLAALSYGTRLSSGTGSGSVKSERLSEYQVSYFSPSELLTSSSSTVRTNATSPIMEVRSILDRYKSVRFPCPSPAC